MSLNQIIATGDKGDWLIPNVSSLSLYGDSNQIEFFKNYAGTTLSLNCAQPAGNVVLTIPDISGSAASATLLTSIFPVSDDTKTRVLTASDSGSVVVVDSAAAASTYTLPNPNQKGLRYKFIVNGVLANAVTISSIGASLYGIAIAADATAVAGTGIVAGLIAAKTSLIFSTASAVGDYIELVSTGVKYLVNVSISVHTTLSSA